jgi:hypothetical protein
MEELLAASVNFLALSIFGMVVLYHFVGATGKSDDD